MYHDLGATSRDAEHWREHNLGQIILRPVDEFESEEEKACGIYERECTTVRAAEDHSAK